MKQSRLGSQVKHDCLSGIISRWKYFAVALAFFTFICAVFAVHVNSFLRTYDLSEKLGFFDFLFQIFAGNRPFDTTDRSVQSLSVAWFTFHAYLLFLTGFYAAEDLKNPAVPFILRVKSKTKWWAGKFVWCILSVTFYYLLLLFCIGLFAVLGGNTGFASESVCSEFFGVEIGGVSKHNIAVVLLFLPFISSVALSSFHMMLSLVVRPLYSFLLGIVFLAAAAFYCHPLLLYNFTMASRNAVFFPGSGITSARGIISALCVTLFSFLGGIVVVRHRDII